MEFIKHNNCVSYYTLNSKLFEDRISIFWENRDELQIKRYIKSEIK